MRNKISLSMIVKNEEKYLERCLRSVKEIVDEMIIVDTGSTDRTKEIALSMGAKVFDYEWKNDFSDARNYSLSHATGDWILMLDADEFFERDQALLLKQTIAHTKENGLYLQIQNLMDESTIGLVHSSIRVFKSVPGLKWMNTIHEAISINGSKINSKETKIKVVHSGYIDTVIKTKNKKERNKELLKKELRKNPKSVAMNFYMGNEYAVEQPKMANQYYEKALKYNKDKAVEAKILSYYLRALLNAEEYDKCLHIITKSKNSYPDFTDLYYMEGNIYEYYGRIYDAKLTYQKCLQLGTPNEKYISANGVGNILPLEKLILIAVNERDWNQVLELFLKIVELDKFHKKVIYLFHVISQLYQNQELSLLLDQLYNENNPRELMMKYKIALFLRSPILLPKLYRKIGQKGLLSGDFFHYYLTNQYQEAKEVLLNQTDKTNEWYVYALLLLSKFKDNELENKLSDNDFAKLLLNGVRKETLVVGESEDKMYVSLIEETLKLKDYKLFDTLNISINGFSNQTLKSVAIKLFEYFHDELAINYLLQFVDKEEEKNNEVLLKISELQYSSGRFQEALQNAQDSITGDNFRPFEIMLNSAIQLKEFTLTEEILGSLIKEVPESKYLHHIRNLVN